MDLETTFKNYIMAFWTSSISIDTHYFKMLTKCINYMYIIIFPRTTKVRLKLMIVIVLVTGKNNYYLLIKRRHLQLIETKLLILKRNGTSMQNQACFFGKGGASFIPALIYSRRLQSNSRNRVASPLC